jgi:hypothetical protein
VELVGAPAQLRSIPRIRIASGWRNASRNRKRFSGISHSSAFRRSEHGLRALTEAMGNDRDLVRDAGLEVQTVPRFSWPSSSWGAVYVSRPRPARDAHPAAAPGYRMVLR